MRLVRIVFAASLVWTAVSHGQDAKTKKAAAPQRPKETFLEWALRFAGISANPNTLKSGEEMQGGQVWVADVAGGTRRKITADEGYRSPVYFPAGSDILALQGGYVVRIPTGSDRAEKLYRAENITKLVGFSRETPGEVLALTEDDARRVVPATLLVNSGGITPFPFDPQSSRDRQMLEHLEGWQRSYGETVVYVKREPRQALSGSVEVFNVFLKTPGRDPVNISDCDMANCGQPSLSPDGSRVLFIKASQ
jgi:Holliday junction resolvase